MQNKDRSREKILDASDTALLESRKSALFGMAGSQKENTKEILREELCDLPEIKDEDYQKGEFSERLE